MGSEAQARAFACLDGVFLVVEFHISILLRPFKLRHAALYRIKMHLQLRTAHGVLSTTSHERSQEVDDMARGIIGATKIREYPGILFSCETVISRLGTEPGDFVLDCP